MEDIILDAHIREETGSGKVKDIRRQGFVPGVVYGQGNKSQVLKVSHKELMMLVHQHHIENAVINLKIKGDSKNKPKPCVVREIQYDPVSGDIIHIDFNEISLTEVIKVNVPIVAKGEPIGVKQEGGSLEHILWEVEVECLPTEIPQEFEVDVSQLKIGDSVHIKDIQFPGNIKILAEPEEIVMSVAAPMKEEAPAEEAVEGEEKQEPEVIREKKEAPEEAEAKEEEQNE